MTPIANLFVMTPEAVDCAREMVTGDFNYIPGIIFTVVSLGTIAGILWEERRALRRMEQRWDREDKQAMGGPVLEPPDPEQLRALRGMLRQ